ncbi:hypothetical protein QFZ56_002683 [Streptomyces achromogenes]|uniref:Uncharacterized protein n=1 Tax=Streptomyces achromogenes TaxID=67255 RepID=A0ABU0PZ84_STRAH|nr:hypothetical protein [Streptomyces achromogenes]
MPICTRASESEPPLKLRCLKRTSGTIGEGVTFSQTTNPARPRTATARLRAERPPNAPCSGSSMIHQTSAVMPTAESTAPSGSGFCQGALDSGIRVTAATTASTTTGTLIRKIECQEKWSMRTPPRTGLPTRPSMDTEPHAAIALPRSSSSKTVMRIDSVDGMISAPPTPIAVRTAITSPGSVQNVAASEAAPNSVRPISMTRRRPKRSPRLPEVSSRPAKTRM